MGTACPNFVEKTFADGSKPTKFMNVFSLKSFLLYGININFLVCYHLHTQTHFMKLTHKGSNLNMGISYNFSHFHSHIQEPQKSLSEKVCLKIGGLQIHLHMYVYNTVNIHVKAGIPLDCQ